MKFVYQYRTRDNVVHSDVISARDRDSAFQILRSRGVRPARLEEASGVLNKVLGKGKRWMAIVALALTCVVVSVCWIRNIASVGDSELILKATPRHQIYGDPALVARLETWQGLLDVLGSNRVGYIELAAYAQPGKVPDLAGRSYSTLSFGQALAMALTNDLEILSNEQREIRELKQIVNGMRQEMKEYVADAGGVFALEQYANRLRDRTREEQHIYESVRKELSTESDAGVWDAKNASLRKLGLPTIPVPE